MNSPRIPTWLLQRCLGRPLAESVLGDLMEQYQQGRSRLWFWRQAAVTLIVVSARDMREHVGLVASRLVLGWAIYLAPGFIIVSLGRTIQSMLGPWRATGPEWLRLVIARAPYELPVYFACFVGGWVVSRLFRSHGVPIAILLAATIGVFEYTHIAWMLLAHGHRPMPLAAWLLPAVLVVLRPASVLLGGVVGAGDGQQLHGAVA